MRCRPADTSEVRIYLRNRVSPTLNRPVRGEHRLGDPCLCVSLRIRPRLSRQYITYPLQPTASNQLTMGP